MTSKESIIVSERKKPLVLARDILRKLNDGKNLCLTKDIAASLGMLYSLEQDSLTREEFLSSFREAKVRVIKRFDHKHLIQRLPDEDERKYFASIGRKVHYVKLKGKERNKLAIDHWRSLLRVFATRAVLGDLGLIPSELKFIEGFLTSLEGHTAGLSEKEFNQIVEDFIIKIDPSLAD